MSWRFLVQSTTACLLALAVAPPGYALGEEPYVTYSPLPGALALVHETAAPLVVDAQDWPGVLRALSDLQADVERVSGVRPEIATSIPAPAGNIVIVGTLGRSALIDGLVHSNKLDPGAITGRWEAFLIEVVAHPLPGVERALVIAGSDKRGTIYGIYSLSEQIGVSPWYWWADVPVVHREALFVKPGRFVQGPPAVRYRGIFLNDEAPDLTNWVMAKFGSVPPRADPPVPQGVANYNHLFYARLFELVLRLKGNYLWPAMWHNAFNEDDPENPRLADEFGVVLGTSHQEPMLRAQEEWDRRYLGTVGHWNYATHPDLLEKFWRDGIRRNKADESIITIGLRGANDTPMAEGGPAANRELLEKIVGVQRNILRDEMNPDVTRVPQLWCLYKEVQEFYDAGMRVPDDVTLLWCDDNWGNLRRLPTPEERQREGGSGIYYHFDYHGGPRSYQWINTSPIAKIWDQLTLARQYGADRIWIVNVGHFKGYEFPLEYFMNLAWDPDRWTNDNINEYTRRWARREFGPTYATDIAEIVSRYTKYNGRRKPELLAPDTYSLIDYQEAETVVADFKAITARAEEIYRQLPADARDAFYELVLFPTKASALVNELYLAAGKNAWYARQGRASTNDWAAETRALFQADTNLMDYFNRTLAGGKWNHFMDQPHLGYTTWRDPPRNNLDAIKLVEIAVPDTAALGVAMEGSDAAWSGAAGDASLPKFDAFNRQRHYIEVFNKGKAPLDVTAVASATWIVLSETRDAVEKPRSLWAKLFPSVAKIRGTVGKDRRLWVGVDWNRAPQGTASGTVKVTGANGEVTIKVEAFNPIEVTRASLQGFVEGEGFVSIEAEHYAGKTDAGASRWIRIEDSGHTLSAMRATAPVDAPGATPGKDSPCLDYRMYLFSTGRAEVTAILAPTLNFMPRRGLHVAVSFDDETPQTVTLVPQDYIAQHGNMDWEKCVGDNARPVRTTHTLTKPGYHTLKIWMVDPGVVLEKLVVDLGGLKPSYLGPPESYHHHESASSQP